MALAGPSQQIQHPAFGLTGVTIPSAYYLIAEQARGRGPPGSETTPPSPVLELLASDVIMEHLVVIGLADVRVRAQVARTLQGMLQCGGAGVNSGEKAIFRVTH